MWAPEQHVQPEQTSSTFTDGQYGAPNFEDLTTINAFSILEYWYQQSPCPKTVTSIPNIVHMEAQQYTDLQPFIPPPAMTYNELPVYTAGMNPLPTFGGQNENDCLIIVQPVPPAPPAPPVNAPVSKKVKKPKEVKVEEGPHIKKPPNAFMLFLKEHRKSAEEELGVRTSSVVNKLLGELWKSFSSEEKDQYNTKAKYYALLHHEQNTGWTNKQNYAKKRKQNRTVIKTVGVSTCPTYYP
ncbi:transcription factor 7-like 1 [Gouania willdenowi]|uniref:transcription factor 7-like 1 n=1 Tax=Gouania willdenowi TaxID=441366 RepID=UPI001055027B|nr:transcription factor 7-like 1 [Gouania willdenowi]